LIHGGGDLRLAAGAKYDGHMKIYDSQEAFD